jgi:hypothetical protein
MTYWWVAAILGCSLSLAALGPGAGDAVTTVDLNDRWILRLTGDAGATCDLQVVQEIAADPMAALAWSGACDTPGSVSMTGTIDKKAGTFTLSGTLVGVAAQVSGSAPYPGNAATGSWVVTQFPAGGGFGAARETPDADLDGDGCNNERELGPDPAVGGARHPINYWDFADVPAGSGDPLARDGAVTVSDIAATVARFGSHDDNGAAPINRNSDPLIPASPPVMPSGAIENYHPAYDRTLAGPNPWNAWEPDGAIAVADITHVVAQFGHHCL